MVLLKVQVEIFIIQVQYILGFVPAFYSTDMKRPDEPLFDMEDPFEKENKVCVLCRNKITPDYKNVRLLSQFQSQFTGRIFGRHITGLCKNQQELVQNEITKAQNAGLMPIYLKKMEYLEDPELFDVDNPIRPHRF